MSTHSQVELYEEDGCGMGEMDAVEPLRARRADGGTPALGTWGVDSEYGVLTDVLLGPAETFQWMMAANAEYSSLVRDAVRRGLEFDRDLAVRQHAEMVDVYRECGVRVHSLASAPDLPYGVYARDSSFMTPWGAIIGQMANPRRRGEYATTLRFYAEAGIPVYDMVTAGNYEGGDFMIVEPGGALLGYTGFRSEEVAARQVGGWLEAEGLEVFYVPIDEFFVHIDVIVCMLAEKLAAVCVDIADPGLLAWLREKGIEIVPVGFREAMQLGANVMALGNERVLSTRHATELNERMRAHGLTVYDLDMSMFIPAGGGVHCLSQPLRRLPG